MNKYRDQFEVALKNYTLLKQQLEELEGKVKNEEYSASLFAVSQRLREVSKQNRAIAASIVQASRHHNVQ